MKRKYLIPGGGGARGYTPFGIETAKGAKAHDLKEFWHVGRELPPGHQFRDHMADNVWPAEVPSFKDTFLELLRDLRRRRAQGAAGDRPLPRRSTRIISTTRSATAIRCCALLHYPPQSEPTGEHIRAGAHEDINTITLLLGAEEAGLELQTQRRPLDPGLTASPASW